MKRNKLSKIFIIIIVLLLIHGASYFISFLKYNNKNVVETSVLKEENNNLKKKINELEKALIWMSIKTEQNKHDEVDRLQLKVDKLKTEILSRMMR